MKNKISVFFLFFLLIKNVLDKSTSIEINFNRISSMNNEDIILSNYNFDIFISFQIGDQKEKIEKIFIKSDTNEFMLSKYSSSSNSNKYDPELSSSSKKIVYLKSYQLKYTSRASIYKDIFFLSDSMTKELTKFNDISFLYADSLKSEAYPGILGLQLVENDIKNAKPFPSQFNDLKYSENATWMIKYNNDEEGYFYIGDILNEYVFPGFNFEKYRKTNAVVYGNYLSWDLVFSQIKSDDIILNGPMQAFLDFNFGLISCSNEYFNLIKKEFFHGYIEKGKCNELFYNKQNINNKIKINSNFSYIVCDKSIDIEDFPELIFTHSALDYKFKLTYDDVFVSSNDILYFLIINETEKNDRWKLGKIFFQKYNIIFDHNAKTIGIYDNIYSKSKIALIIFEWIIAILLIMVAFFLAYTLIKRYRLNNYKFFMNKVQVNEMEENYNQFFGSDKDNNKHIEVEKNTENKILDK